MTPQQEQYVERLVPFAHWYVERYATSVPTQDREDVAQDILLDLVQHVGAYDPARGALSTWAYQRARHAVEKYMGARFSKKRGPDAMTLRYGVCPEYIPRFSPGCLLRPGRGVPKQRTTDRPTEDTAISHLCGTRASRALDQLPIDDRTIFRLVVVEGRSQVDVARMYGASKLRIARTLDRVAEYVKATVDMDSS